MALGLERRYGWVLRGIAVGVRTGTTVGGRMRASLVRLAACVLLLVPGMDQPLMADEEIASSERFGAYLADEGLLFRMCSDMSLEVFLLSRQSGVVRGAAARHHDGVVPGERTIFGSADRARSWTLNHSVSASLCQMALCSGAHCRP